MTREPKRKFHLILLLSVLFGVMFGAISSPSSIVPSALALDGGEYICPSADIPAGCGSFGCKTKFKNGHNVQVCSLYNTENGVICNQTIDCAWEPPLIE